MVGLGLDWEGLGRTLIYLATSGRNLTLHLGRRQSNAASVPRMLILRGFPGLRARNSLHFGDKRGQGLLEIFVAVVLHHRALRVFG